MHSAQRTLVKSPPELWSEVSDPAALARHLGEFGEIRITRVEPEATVAWEGDRVRGTVSLEPSGWGTKVTLFAEAEPEPEPEPVAVQPEPRPEPEPEPVVEAAPPERRGFFRRMFGRRRPLPEAELVPEPEPVAVPPTPMPEPVAAQPEPEPEPVNAESPPPVLEAEATLAKLEAVLDDLGAAHHRPFSRG